MEGGPAVSAREAILARVRKVTERGVPEAERRAAVDERLRLRPPGPIPHQATSHGPQRLTQFMAKLEAVSATVSRVSSLAELPRAMAHELRNRNLPASIRTGTDPIFNGLDWHTIAVSHGPGRIEEPATLSRAEFGVAETGTLILASGPHNPVTLTFLGETHFVVLRTADITGGLEDMWQAWRARGLDPRTINMVTGPSRSADIGQILQLGAHGPIALHVFLLD
jgi:L-lactate utilization protein LutC